MSDRAVKVVSSRREATDDLLDRIPVAFVAYDPEAYALGATAADKAVEKLLRSTDRTAVFGQVARKMQASGSFGLLDPEASKEEIARFFEGGDGEVPSGGFIARIEEDVPIRLYDGELDSAALLEWATEQNLAVVLELGGHNFRFVSRRGKALAIAAYDPDEGAKAKTDAFKRELKRYAIRGEFKDDYVYGTMDGKKWAKFLSQFAITEENLPELFVLDAPSRTYWQDASVFGVAEFVAAVKAGEVVPREQEKRKGGALEEVMQAFVDFMPYSLLAMLALFLGVFWLALPRMGGDDLVYPPPPPPPSSTAPPKEEDDDEGTAEENEENKKDR